MLQVQAWLSEKTSKITRSSDRFVDAGQELVTVVGPLQQREGGPKEGGENTPQSAPLAMRRQKRLRDSGKLDDLKPKGPEKKGLFQLLAKFHCWRLAATSDCLSSEALLTPWESSFCNEAGIELRPSKTAPA